MARALNPGFCAMRRRAHVISESRAHKVFSGTIPLGGEGNNEGMKALFVHPGPLHESVSAA